MLRKFSLRKRLSAIVFIAVVALSGVALAASGNLQNPFSAVSEITSLVSGNSAGPGGENLDAGGPPAGEERGTPPDDATMQRGGEGGDSTFQWSQIGGVLYNLWVIAAAGAVMMIIGPVIGWGIKQFQRGIKRLTPARAPAW